MRANVFGVTNDEAQLGSPGSHVANSRDQRRPPSPQSLWIKAIEVKPKGDCDGMEYGIHDFRVYGCRSL